MGEIDLKDQMIVVTEAEFHRAFDEALLKIEKSLKEPSTLPDPLRTFVYYVVRELVVRELQGRLERG